MEVVGAINHAIFFYILSPRKGTLAEAGGGDGGRAIKKKEQVRKQYMFLIYLFTRARTLKHTMDWSSVHAINLTMLDR